MTYKPFPSFGGRFGFARELKPLWAIEFEDDDTFLSWFKTVEDQLQDEYQEIARRDLENRDFYMGLQSLAVGKEGIPRDKVGRSIEKFSRVTINRCYELTEQWVSKMTRFAPAIAVIPPNQEYNDRIAAKLSKAFIDYLFYTNEMDDLLEDAARQSRIFGEAFCLITYNKAKGDLHPQYAQAQQMGYRVPLVDPATGEQILSDDGEPLFIEKAQRVGDVEYKLIERRFIVKQPKSKWRDVEWIIVISPMDSDELKAKYPEKADELSGGASRAPVFMNMYEAQEEYNETLVYDLYHRSTEFLSGGRHIRFTADVVLENKPLREEVGFDEELPVARLSNIDVPGIVHGLSFLEQFKLLQVLYNNTASIAYTNLALGAHLYWLLPTAANVDLKKLKNGSSVIKYAGGVPPTLQQYKTIGQEIFNALEFFDQQILRESGIQGVSRGEPPAGIDAGIALAFLEEQENQRANTDIKKHNAFIKKLARLSLACAGAFYRPEDGRTIRVVGKNNEFSIKALDVAKLGGPYDIRVQRTTALSESKSGRLSQILALEGRFPGLVPREQVLDMLDLANDQKFYDVGAVAVRTAERENELLGEGQAVAPPEDFEDHLVHLYTLIKYMQSASFKEDMPIEYRQGFIDHGAAHEYFIHRKLMLSPVYAQRVYSMIPDFPVFSLPGQVGAPIIPSAPGDISQAANIAQSIQGAPPGTPGLQGMAMDMAADGAPMGEQAGLPTNEAKPPLPPSEQPEAPPI